MSLPLTESRFESLQEGLGVLASLEASAATLDKYIEREFREERSRFWATKINEQFQTLAQQTNEKLEQTELREVGEYLRQLTMLLQLPLIDSQNSLIFYEIRGQVWHKLQALRQQSESCMSKVLVLARTQTRNKDTEDDFSFDDITTSSDFTSLRSCLKGLKEAEWVTQYNPGDYRKLLNQLTEPLQQFVLSCASRVRGAALRRLENADKLKEMHSVVVCLPIRPILN
jgi:hypothetical protein